jgi:DNA repair exonuclease SbcCD ATPase subunit
VQLTKEEYMSIKLGYIIIENFNTYLGRHKISFKEAQGNLVLIKGINDIDGSSNGAGKSSIVDALIMAFFGRSIKKELNLDDLVCNKTSDPLRLELGFEDSSDGVVLNTYVIERVRAKAPNAISKCNLYQNGSCISNNSTLTETQNKIEKIIGVDYNTFMNNNVLNPELFRFVKGSNTQKVDTLERVLNLYIVSRISNLFSGLVKEDQEVFSKVDTEFYALKTSLTNMKQQTEKVTEHVQKDINTILENNTKIEDQVKELVAFLNETSGKIYFLNPIVEKINEQIEEHKSEIAKINEKIRENKKILKYYEDNEKCHACNQLLPDREAIIKDEAEKLKINVELHKAFSDKLKSYQDSESLTDYAALLEAKNSTNTKIKEKKYNITQNIKNIDKLKSITNTSNAGKIEDVIKQLAETEVDWKTSKERLEKTEFWKELIAPKSKTRMEIASNLLSVLNNYIQKYIKNFFNEDFRFSFVVKDNNIDEHIIKHGKRMKYDQLSSGERQKVDIVIVISLLDIAMSYFKNNKLKFLVIDEALDHLDPVWGKYVIEFIKQYAISMNMMCLLISHHSVVDEVDFLFDNKIIARKGLDDNSYIQKNNVS